MSDVEKMMQKVSVQFLELCNGSFITTHLMDKIATIDWHSECNL